MERPGFKLAASKQPMQRPRWADGWVGVRRVVVGCGGLGFGWGGVLYLGGPVDVFGGAREERLGAGTSQGEVQADFGIEAAVKQHCAWSAAAGGALR